MVCFCPWCTALKITISVFFDQTYSMYAYLTMSEASPKNNRPPTSSNYEFVSAAFCQQPGSNTNRDSHKMPSTSSSVSILAVSRASLVCICHITWSRTLPFHHRFHPTLSKEAWIERNTVPGIQWSFNRGDFPPKWIMFKSKTQRRLKNIVESTPSKQPTFFWRSHCLWHTSPSPQNKGSDVHPQNFWIHHFWRKTWCDSMFQRPLPGRPVTEVLSSSSLIYACLGGEWVSIRSISDEYLIHEKATSSKLLTLFKLWLLAGKKGPANQKTNTSRTSGTKWVFLWMVVPQKQENPSCWVPPF